MTDKEKLQYILDNFDTTSIESIFNHFLMYYIDELPISTINELHKQVNNVLNIKIEQLNRANWVACEKATYIKTYLEGNIWKNEEDAKANLQPQIDNAQAIIEACGQR